MFDTTIILLIIILALLLYDGIVETARWSADRRLEKYEKRQMIKILYGFSTYKTFCETPGSWDSEEWNELDKVARSFRQYIENEYGIKEKDFIE